MGTGGLSCKFCNPKLVEIELAIAPPENAGPPEHQLQSKASTALSLACGPTAPNSSAQIGIAAINWVV
jgi:hypothetical protein